MSKIFSTFFLFLLLTGCASLPYGDRRINIVHFPSGERVNAVYAHDGRYDRRVMKQISTLFRDRTTNEVYDIDPKLIDLIGNLLSALALPPDTQIQLTSGYRSPARNAELAAHDKNVGRESYHTKGQAADIRIAGVDGKAVAAIAQTLQGGGVAYYPKSHHIHVDTGTVRSWQPRS